MLTKIDTPDEDITAFKVDGHLTQKDYSNIFIPFVLQARATGEKLKFLIQFGDEFQGFTPSAAWEDFKLGIQHMGVFERIAIVSDKACKNFPGWENLGSLFSHIQFVKNHHKKIKKVALAADTKLTDLFPKLASHFIEAEIKQFNYDEMNEARDWASL